MKNKMTGIILMVVGALVLGVGVFVFTTSSKQNIVAASGSEVTKVVDINKDTLPIGTAEGAELVKPEKSEVKDDPISKVEAREDTELEKVIEMAIADGVLTTNERNLIKKTAISKGVDYVEVLDDVEKRVELLEIDSETELVNLEEKNGLDFEKFIVQKFNTDYFKVKEWAGDKFVKGVYAETTQYPDLLMVFFGYKQNKEFAVECKWRQNIYMKGIEFSNPNQLNRYRDYAKRKNIPVFMTIGLGGKGASPDRLFIVPLQDISEPFMLLSELKKYEKRDLKANFYFDYKKEELR